MGLLFIYSFSTCFSPSTMYKALVGSKGLDLSDLKRVTDRKGFGFPGPTWRPRPCGPVPVLQVDPGFSRAALLASHQLS